MVPDESSFRRQDRPRRARQISREEIAKRPLADETDSGRIFFGPRRDALAARDCANIALVHRPERKHRRRELRLRQAMQKIALVFRPIDGLHQHDRTAAIRGSAQARVVPCRDRIGAERHRMIEKRAKFDFTVAQDIRIRRASRFVFAQKLFEHALAIFRREIDRFEVDADDVRDRCRIDEVFARRAVFVGVVVLPVLHEQADDVEALPLQQPRGNRPPDMPTITRLRGLIRLR